jgi:transposase InsO family protein
MSQFFPRAQSAQPAVDHTLHSTDPSMDCQNTFVLSDAQIRLLERHSSDFRSRHVHASRPGELLNQDTFYWGALKGVGKVYVQVIVDVTCSFAFAKAYTSKMPITACDLMHDRVLPFYENLGITVGAVLTDNGREFCGKPESHPYELLLAVEGIKDRTTKVRSPRTNGFVERMNRTLLGECFRVQGRTKWYTSPDEIQADLDTFMVFYNFRRTHHGYRVAGRTRPRRSMTSSPPSGSYRPCQSPQEVPLPADRPSPPRTGCRGNTRLVQSGNTQLVLYSLLRASKSLKLLLL